MIADLADWDNQLEEIGIHEESRVHGKQVEHPDVTYATRNYDGTPTGFDHMIELRNEAIENDENYWQDEHDIELKETAEERTLWKAAEGWVWPVVGSRKKQG